MTYKLTMHEQFTTARLPEEAFDYIVDFSKIQEWDHTIVESEKVTQGLIGLGSRFDLVYKMGLRKLPISYQITEFTPSSSAILVGESDNFTAIDTVNITATDEGCHVDWHAEITFRGLSAKIVPLIEKKIKSAGAQTIRDLKTALDDTFDAPKLSALKSVADKLILPGVLSFSKYGYSHSQKHWKPVSNSIKGQHIVITGATSGLGLACAYELAHRGAQLTLVARNKTKAKEVADDIAMSTGNKHIAVEIADLSIMKDVTNLGKRLLKKDQTIDVLINNAGALLNPRQETSEGLETSFALLLLGPYILTTQLQPLLKASGHARVINVSSGGMYAKRLSVNNLQSIKGEYSGSDAYARSKRGLVITGEQWAKEWAEDGITVHNMHPGWAHTPGVEVGLPEFTKLTKRILRTPAQGADTIIWLACASEVSNTTGLFWLDRAPHSTHLSSKTKETAAQRLELRSELDRLGRLFGL